MCEGDYGRSLPLAIVGEAPGEDEAVMLTIKHTANSTAVIEKSFSDFSTRYPNGVQTICVDLILTAAESAELPVGNYVYSLDWYKSGAFLCNIVPLASFKVVDKA